MQLNQSQLLASGPPECRKVEGGLFMVEKVLNWWTLEIKSWMVVEGKHTHPSSAGRHRLQVDILSVSGSRWWIIGDSGHSL